jgi:ornithine--oxo-acid transaminase
MIADEI